MISVTKLLCDTEHYGDSLRYSQGARDQVHGASADMALWWSGMLPAPAI